MNYEKKQAKMRPQSLGGQRLKIAGGAIALHAAHAAPHASKQHFRVDEHVGHGDAGTGPVSQWFENMFVRVCRALFGTGLDPEHME